MLKGSILKWPALTISALLVVIVVALVIAYPMSDNDCEERRATAPKNPIESHHVSRVRRD